MIRRRDRMERRHDKILHSWQTRVSGGLGQYIIRFVAPPFYGTLTNTIEMLHRIKVLSQRAYPLWNPGHDRV